jgi:hypothetical protein
MPSRTNVWSTNSRRRQAVTRCKRLGGNWPPVLLQRHINDRGYGEEPFL